MRQTVHAIAAATIFSIVALTIWGVIAPFSIVAGTAQDEFIVQRGDVFIFGDAQSFVAPVAILAVFIGFHGWRLVAQRRLPWQAPPADASIDPSDARLAGLAALGVTLCWVFIASGLGIFSPRTVAPVPGWWVSIDTPVFDIRSAVFLLASTAVVSCSAQVIAHAYMAGAFERVTEALKPASGSSFGHHS